MKKKGAKELLLSAAKTSDALHSMWSGLEANPEQLAARLRQGDATKAEMALAADLIEAKIKPRRPRSSREQRLIIAEHVAWVKKIKPTWQRRRIIESTVDYLKNLHSPPMRYISARQVYKALAEFDRDTVARINRMPKDENEHGHITPPNQRLREMLKDASHEILVKIIEGFLGRP
jgi:hypothetical protein